jgi:transposase
VTDNDVQPNKQGSRRPKLSPLERRKLAVIGVKAGKSKRSIAKELGVSARTIHRDLKNPRKPTKKTRSAGARRKPDTPQKAELPKGTQQRKRTITPVRMPNAPIELQEQLKMSSDSEKSKTPEEVRQLRLQEMVQLADSWLAEQRRNYWRAINVVDKARNRLNASSYGYFRGIPEPSKRAAELRDQNRPEEMDSASSQSLLRREEVCAQWLARWMAAWAPRDEELRNEVFNQVRAKQRVYPYFG